MRRELLRIKVSVLLVEDDETVRECLTELLIDAGWRIVAAASAEQALTLAEARGAPDVLITDHLLGSGMSGRALISAARHRWPMVGAVLISGADLAEPMLAARDRYLRKPFSGAELNQIVAELAGPGSSSMIMGPFGSSLGNSHRPTLQP